ncbi:MAG: BCCT family transporter [Pseudomonadota bacterium]
MAATQLSNPSRRFNATTTLAFCALSAVLALAMLAPEQVGQYADWLNGAIISVFGRWYVWLLAGCTLMCAVALAWPKVGRLRLGQAGDAPAHSTAAWIAMMYGAGISAALIKWSIAEPLEFTLSNPDLIQNTVEAHTEGNMRMAIKWAFLHWGFGAWSAYAVFGLALAFVCFRNGLPLTIGATLQPVLGERATRYLEKPINAAVILVSLLCSIQILHFALDQVAANISYLDRTHKIGVAELSGVASVLSVALICALTAKCLRQGLHGGIRIAANTSLAVTAAFLALLLAASGFSGFEALVTCIGDYVFALPDMAVRVWQGDRSVPTLAGELESWQVQWSMFHWTWWIPFTLFVGAFMARISRGRTVREFVLCAMVVPSLLCWVWLTWAGGIAIDVEMSALGALSWVEVDNNYKLLALIAKLFTPKASLVLGLLVIALLIAYSVTTLNASLWVVAGLAARHSVGKRPPAHLGKWALLLALTTWLTQLGGAQAAIQAIACVSALPVSLLIAMNAGSLCVAVLRTVRPVDDTRSDVAVPVNAGAHSGQG